MLQILTHAVYTVPKEFLIPIAVGVAFAGLGLFFFPPTYHWDGKRSVDYPR